jgi:succinyl-CoA synthetase alpha subunit
VHGVPVYDTVAKALADHPAEASVISVPPVAVREAAGEAIAEGLSLVVIVTERVPRRDVAEVLALARERGTRVIGPNSLGLISVGKTKVGMVGGPAEDVRKAYRLGPVGILSRSGGMTTEIATLLSGAGLGQSTCVSVGGDPIIGSTFTDLFPLFAADAETRAVVIFGEPGGSAEEALAEYLTRERPRTPVVAFIAGRFVDELPGVRFGHAGAIVEGEAGRVAVKIRRLRQAAVAVAEEFSEIVPLVRERL